MPLDRRRFLAGTAGCLALYAAPASASFMARVAFVDLVEQQLADAVRPQHVDEVWVLVDDRACMLDVYRGGTRIERFSPVSIGRGGAATQRISGSSVTPKGEFRVNRFNFDSRWHLFMGVDYPTPDHARMALRTGLYSREEYQAYFDHYRRYKTPPQDTVLGGAIGLHGLGPADPAIHRRMNWTQGCVAMTDAQIDRLKTQVDMGTRVVIR
ncbi:hypothetical protein GCM10022228_18150 [Halomonas cibimaris]|uniref:L,D-TPase catalytic domain-containing protein n=1 Tax=Halomonas cibimaris TaxID=657012 RepID=A0ABP7LV35_9GAMM